MASPKQLREKWRKPLPPLDYLLAFEVTAQTGSFAAAAKQMRISETAIARKVKLLEDHFELSFFDRKHRSITLSAQGTAFLSRISPALDMLRAAADDTRGLSYKRPIVLAATNSVAALWLTPRLHAFRQANTHLKIMLLASDNDSECLADSVDLTILRGDGNWPGYRSSLLFGETIFPVCSPDFLAQHPKAAALAQLPNLPLIEVASAHTEWMNWRTWLGQKGIEAHNFDEVTLFNTYPLSIYAAMDGLGIALGWGHLVDQMIASGKLVRPIPEASVRTNHGYYLLMPERRKHPAPVTEVANWLTEISAKRRRYGPDPSSE